MTEALPLSKRCDHCGGHMIVKVQAAAGRAAGWPILQWYYFCHACNILEVFMEEPLEAS